MTQAVEHRDLFSSAPGDPPPDSRGSPDGRWGRGSPRRSALQLFLALAGIVALSAATGHLDLLAVIVSLIVIVMVHELGHFAVAKKCRMKVTEYFVGFGPRLWSFRRGETEYGVRALPLGGYVRIPGMNNLEEVDPSDESRTYRRQPVGARVAVSFAGPAMNLLFAIVLAWYLVTFIGVPNSNQVQFQAVDHLGGRAGPAQVAGIRPGDILVSIDGKTVHGNETTVADIVRSHPGVPLSVVVERGGREETLTVTPANGRVVHEQGVDVPAGKAPFGVIGVTFGEPLTRQNPLRALATVPQDIWNVTSSSVVALGHLFTPGAISRQFHDVSSAQAASQAAANGTRAYSIVGIVNLANSAAEAGIGVFLSYMIVINVFLGLINLLPLLPLDGGYIAIALYERIRQGRSRVPYHADAAKLLPLTWAALMLLAIIVVPALLTDIVHPAANPFG